MLRYKSFALWSLLFVTALNVSFAQSKKEETTTVKVWGNCGMCKKLIEKTALANGATVANWNTETKMLELKYPKGKTTSDKIQQAIANVGYDTEKFTANQEAYDNLHECCKYERKAAGNVAAAAHAGHEGNHHMHHASCEMKDGKCTGDKECCKNGECKDNCSKDGKCTHAGKEGHTCKADGSCCKKEGATAQCCKEGKCEKGNGECKDAAQCKEKGCCKV